MRNDLRNETDKPALKAHFYQLPKSYVYNYKSAKSNLEMHGILHLLQYEEAIFDIIINKIKFKEFSHDVTKNHEEKL